MESYSDVSKKVGKDGSEVVEARVKRVGTMAPGIVTLDYSFFARFLTHSRLPPLELWLEPSLPLLSRRSLTALPCPPRPT